MATHPRRYQGGLIVGLLLIGLGVLFFVDQFLKIDLWVYLWPFIIISIGLLFFAGMVNRGKRAGALAIPGSMCIMLGLVSLFQTIIDYEASSAYMWTLVAPTSVGIGLVIFGWWSERPALRRAGVIVTVVGLLLFLTMGALFEILFNLNGQLTPARFILPVLLIGLGLFLLFGHDLIRRLVSAVTGMPAVEEERANVEQIVEPRETDF